MIESNVLVESPNIGMLDHLKRLKSIAKRVHPAPFEAATRQAATQLPASSPGSTEVPIQHSVNECLVGELLSPGELLRSLRQCDSREV